jgi:hypothetical protein
VALKRERKIRLFQSDTYVSVDYMERAGAVCRAPGRRRQLPKIDGRRAGVQRRRRPVRRDRGFVGSVRTREKPPVDVDGRAGPRGRACWTLAERINAGAMETE